MRDSLVRFALKATMPTCRCARAAWHRPLYDVAQTSLIQDVASSTYTDFYGTAGTCFAQTAGATGGGTIASVGSALVFRPSSDAVLDLECADRFARFSMSVDLLQVAASNVVPELGQAPLDVAFAIPPKRFGARRITLPVAASAAQRAFERCPREDPGHTVACPFGWEGTRDARPADARGRAPARGGAAQVNVRCAAACAPVVPRRLAARRTLRVPGAASAAPRDAAPRAGAPGSWSRSATSGPFTLRRAAMRRSAARRSRACTPARRAGRGGSLAYAKGGDVYLSAPDGSRAARMTSDGGYAWPSQADDGTLVAVRQTAENGRTPRRLHRFGARRRRLGAPIETVPVGNANLHRPARAAGVARRLDGRLPLLQHRRR